MKANLQQLEEMQKELFRQQCDLDIQKAMVKHFIKKKKAEQLTLTDVSGMLILTPKDAELFFNEVIEKPKKANEALKKAMLKFITR